ncbi:MAG: glycosyltransferase family 4 protein [Cyanobacteria bacterium K_DeepCast_35m_m1_288]|nr:glycosyltransferase family 4 protein [Cyanobacteria bacterium K_DeepCast_35m_m1_288]
MTLLLNYRPVLRKPTGIGVYANSVLPALQELPHVLVPGGEEGTAKQRLKRLLWTQLELPRLTKRSKATLIFTPAPEGYLGPQTIPQVVMVHDLRPISHPERSFQSLYFRSWVPPLLRSCRHVLTNSQFTAQEIQRCTRLHDSRITVTPLGYDDQVFKPGPPPPGSQEQPYLLHVGQQYPHKNLRRLIQAFAEIATRYPELRLVLAGKPHPTETPVLQAMVLELGLWHRVEFRSYVTYADLPDLYRGSLAFVYPSLWEGFGLPILEAMACGTPVITSKGSGTEEVAGDAAILIDPCDGNALFTAINVLIEQKTFRVQCRSRGLERASHSSWVGTREMVKTLFRYLL